MAQKKQPFDLHLAPLSPTQEAVMKVMTTRSSQSPTMIVALGDACHSQPVLARYW